MKTQYLLFSLLLCGLTATAQDSVGFDFSDEDVAADAQFAKQQELQALIGNAAKYEAAAHESYAIVVNSIAGCCNQLKGHKDLVDCSNYPDADTLHKEALANLLANYPFDMSSGQFTEGVLSQVMLSKAKPNMTGDQVTRIEHMITRAETMMQWFTGPFRLACAVHNHDFQKEVQRVARFIEYTKTDEFKSADEAYRALVIYFDSNDVPNRAMTAERSFGYNQQQAYVFYNYFHNRISDQEREKWLNFVLMGRSLRYRYDGPVLNLSNEITLSTGKPVYWYIDIHGAKPRMAATELASKLSSYINTFQRWNPQRLDDVQSWGKKAFDQLHNAIGHATFNKLDTLAGETLVKEDIDFKEAVQKAIPNGLQALMEKEDLLMGLPDYLADNTKYVDNCKFESKTSLRARVLRRMEMANRILDNIASKAAKIVPSYHPSRQSD